MVRFLLGVGGTALVLGLLVAPGSLAGSSSQSRTFTVSTRSSAWLDTHLKIRAGTTAQIVVTGGNGTCHPGAVGCPRKPDGAGFKCENTAAGKVYAPGPAGANFLYGVVAGRVGASGKPFVVGRRASAKGPGELYLVYNDCAPPAGYRDNRGSWTVKVTGTFS